MKFYWGTKLEMNNTSIKATNFAKIIDTAVPQRLAYLVTVLGAYTASFGDFGGGGGSGFGGAHGMMGKFDSPSITMVAKKGISVCKPWTTYRLARLAATRGVPHLASTFLSHLLLLISPGQQQPQKPPPAAPLPTTNPSSVLSPPPSSSHLQKHQYLQLSETRRYWLEGLNALCEAEASLCGCGSRGAR